MQIRYHSITVDPSQIGTIMLPVLLYSILSAYEVQSISPNVASNTFDYNGVTMRVAHPFCTLYFYYEEIHGERLYVGADYQVLEFVSAALNFKTR